MRIIYAALAAILIVIPAVAETPPKLPPTAKKLTGAEITALYDGATIAWNNFTQKITMIGTATFDLKKKTQSRTWQGGGKSGTFTGTARVKGSKFCHKVGNTKEVCHSVYIDGTDIYEVSDKGIVDSQNKKQ